MRKSWSVVLVSLVLFGFSSLLFAEEKKCDMKSKDMMKGGMMGHGMMAGPEMMGMGPMMMGRSLVATSDGGVVVMIGNKLQKYDKNLVLQKEVEIEKGSMQKPMGVCPGMSENMKAGKKYSREKTEAKSEQEEENQ